MVRIVARPTTIEPSSITVRFRSSRDGDSALSDCDSYMYRSLKDENSVNLLAATFQVQNDDPEQLVIRAPTVKPNGSGPGFRAIVLVVGDDTLVAGIVRHLVI